jgi:hypothetical protein
MPGYGIVLLFSVRELYGRYAVEQNKLVMNAGMLRLV